MPGPTDAPPVVFIDGLWLHASSWQPWTTPVFRNPANKHRSVSLTAEFPDRGHSLTIDSGWREVADAALTWLHKQGL